MANNNKLLIGELYYQLKQQKFSVEEADKYSIAIANILLNEADLDKLSRLSVAIQNVVIDIAAHS